MPEIKTLQARVLIDNHMLPRMQLELERYRMELMEQAARHLAAEMLKENMIEFSTVHDPYMSQEALHATVSIVLPGVPYRLARSPTQEDLLLSEIERYVHEWGTREGMRGDDQESYIPKSIVFRILRSLKGRFFADSPKSIVAPTAAPPDERRRREQWEQMKDWLKF